MRPVGYTEDHDGGPAGGAVRRPAGPRRGIEPITCGARSLGQFLKRTVAELNKPVFELSTHEFNGKIGPAEVK